MDFSKLTSAELKQVKDHVETALIERQRQDLIDAKAAAEAAVAEYGFSLAELADGTKSGKRTKAAPKYRNPDNHDQTWTGRGRRPAWINTAIDACKDISELEI